MLLLFVQETFTEWFCLTDKLLVTCLTFFAFDIIILEIIELKLSTNI